MKLLPNLIALILVPALLAAVLYIGPTMIVACEWRREQVSIEKGMTTAIRLKAMREKYVGRALRAFNYSSYTYREVQDFLEDYMMRVRPLYAEYLANGRFVEIGDTTNTLFTYPNSLALLVSYALTAGYTNLYVKDAYGQFVLAIFAYIGTILLSIIVASMCQTYNYALRFLFAKIVRLDVSTTNPDRVSYKYMWAVAKRDGLVLIATLILLIAAIAAGTVMMMYDQPDWTWTVALVYIQAAAFTSGHTKYIPGPIEANETSVLYVMFMLALHVWLVSFMALFLNAIIVFVRSIYMTQWAEITDQQLYELQEKIERRKQLRQLENPKYEE